LLVLGQVDERLHPGPVRVGEVDAGQGVVAVDGGERRGDEERREHERAGHGGTGGRHRPLLSSFFGSSFVAGGLPTTIASRFPSGEYAAPGLGRVSSWPARRC